MHQQYKDKIIKSRTQYAMEMVSSCSILYFYSYFFLITALIAMALTSRESPDQLAGVKSSK